MPITPSSNARAPLIVGQIVERADGAGTDGVDEDIEFATPPRAQFVEHPLDLLGVCGVSDQSDGIGTAPLRQILCGIVEYRRGPTDEGYACAVLRETARSRESHAAAASDDHRGRVLQPEIHVELAVRYLSSWESASPRTRSPPPSHRSTRRSG